MPYPSAFDRAVVNALVSLFGVQPLVCGTTDPGAFSATPAWVLGTRVSGGRNTLQEVFTVLACNASFHVSGPSRMVPECEAESRDYLLFHNLGRK
jgi:hypothetical protein